MFELIISSFFFSLPTEKLENVNVAAVWNLPSNDQIYCKDNLSIKGKKIA
jgi:hypothetical protein